MSNVNLSHPELATLQEMVWGAIESLQTDGEDTADHPTFTHYCNLYAKLGGTPPAPTEEISPVTRSCAIGLADEPIDITQNGGQQNGES